MLIKKGLKSKKFGLIFFMIMEESAEEGNAPFALFFLSFARSPWENIG